MDTTHFCFEINELGRGKYLPPPKNKKNRNTHTIEFKNNKFPNKGENNKKS